MKTLLLSALVAATAVAQSNEPGDAPKEHAELVRKAVFAMDEAARSEDADVRTAAIDRYYATVEDAVAVLGEDGRFLEPSFAKRLERAEQSAESDETATRRREGPSITNVRVYDVRGDSTFNRHFGRVLQSVEPDVPLYSVWVETETADDSYRTGVFLIRDGQVRKLHDLTKLPRAIEYYKAQAASK